MRWHWRRIRIRPVQNWSNARWRQKHFSESWLRSTLIHHCAFRHSLLLCGRNYVFHILSESAVSFLTMCDTAMPAGIAVAFLEDVAREFLQQYGSQVEAVTRPYCFIKFDLYLSAQRKYLQPNSSRSMNVSRVGRTAPVRRTFEDVMAGIDSKTGSSMSSRGGGVRDTEKTWRFLIICLSLL
ncbi:putative SNARE domain-containing protein [Trypanosoma cruzi]|uniref:Putative SNARE domain-containing protein n=1 Tax=Trypanosoma cruzi TaxID=5693 RepID=A0A2V2XKM9_TRYCR|nr:putative SNARE domain-containing protein [Trypanosoma cruzi]